MISLRHQTEDDVMKSRCYINRLVYLFLTIALIVCTLFAPTSAFSQGLREQIGYHSFLNYSDSNNDTFLNQYFGLTKSVGDWTHIGVHWDMCQADFNSPIVFNNTEANFRNQVDVALDNQLNVVIQVFQTPDPFRIPILKLHYPANNPDINIYRSAYSALPDDPLIIDEWIRYCKALIHEFYPGVSHFEIGNEPNDNWFYRKYAFKEDSVWNQDLVCHYDNSVNILPYAEYLRIAYQAMQEAVIEIQSSDPSIDVPLVILGGSLMETGADSALTPCYDINGQNRIPDITRIENVDSFLNNMYGQNNAHYFDALAYHPYGNFYDERFYDNPLRSDLGQHSNGILYSENLHTIMQQHADGDAKIWATECGPPIITCPDAAGQYNIIRFSEEQQANWANALLDYWTNKSFTGPIMWWSLLRTGDDVFTMPHDNHTDRKSFGVVRSDWSKSPAYNAWKRLGDDFHIGEGAEYLYHEWDQELASRLIGTSFKVDTLTVYFHQKQSPYIINEPFVLATLGCKNIKFIGVTGSMTDWKEANPGEVIVQASNNLMNEPFLTCYDESAGLSFSGLTFSGFGAGSDLDDWDHLYHNYGFCIHFEGAFLSLKNCEFSNNGVGSFSNSYSYSTRFSPAVYFVNQNGKFRIADCIFAGNQSGCQPGASVVVMAADTVQVTGSTFHDNIINIYTDERDMDHPCGSAVDYDVSGHALHIIQADVTQINNCLFTGNYPQGVNGWHPGHLPMFDVNTSSQLSSLTVDHCATDQDFWADQSQSNPPLPSQSGNLVFNNEFAMDSIRYHDPWNHDFRLNFGSACLDSGNPNKIDFDLTASDIGWQPKYKVMDLSGSVGDLPTGFYRITEHTVIGGNIEPGSVIRVESGKNLLIRNVPAGELCRQIGLANQPRTAIVGRPSRNSDPALSISISNVANNVHYSLSLKGVLFNYSPRNPNSLSTSISFSQWQPSIGEGLNIDSRYVQFMNFYNTQTQGNIRYDGGLAINICSGRIAGYNFGSSTGRAPAFVKLDAGRVDVDSCTFVPSATPSSADIPCLKIMNAATGNAPTLCHNVFTGDANLRTTLLDVTQGVVNLQGNRFLDCHDTPLVMSLSTVHAASEARNDLRAAGSFLSGQPLVTMQGGFLDLFCGRNNFVVAGAEVGWPIISWEPELNAPTPASASWRENYWGRTCQIAISEADWNDPSLSLLPPWAAAEDDLSECVELITPANPACPFEPYTPYELLKNGKLEEQAEDYSLAQNNYRFLLWLHPASKEANEGTLRLKALGLHKTYGPDAYETVRADLFVAADSSSIVKLSHQAMLQVCAGYCVEARWGDRATAVSTLETMFRKETDKLNKDTIYLALLEIATYPSQGGISSAGPEAQIAHAVAQQAAVEDLFRFKRGQWSQGTDEVVLPGRFEIANLYPNPFNARTVIEFTLPAEGHTRLRVFNLLGQLVDTPFDGDAAAGRHLVSVDASRWASGIYVVMAEHAGQRQVRKMTLIK